MPQCRAAGLGISQNRIRGSLIPELQGFWFVSSSFLAGNKCAVISVLCCTVANLNSAPFQLAQGRVRGWKGIMEGVSAPGVELGLSLRSLAT